MKKGDEMIMVWKGNKFVGRAESMSEAKKMIQEMRDKKGENKMTRLEAKVFLLGCGEQQGEINRYCEWYDIEDADELILRIKQNYSNSVDSEELKASCIITENRFRPDFEKIVEACAAYYGISAAYIEVRTFCEEFKDCIKWYVEDDRNRYFEKDDDEEEEEEKDGSNFFGLFLTKEMRKKMAKKFGSSEEKAKEELRKTLDKVIEELVNDKNDEVEEEDKEKDSSDYFGLLLKKMAENLNDEEDEDYNSVTINFQEKFIKQVKEKFGSKKKAKEEINNCLDKALVELVEDEEEESIPKKSLETRMALLIEMYLRSVSSGE